jgi:hypothetical protein
MGLGLTICLLHWSTDNTKIPEANDSISIRPVFLSWFVSAGQYIHQRVRFPARSDSPKISKIPEASGGLMLML